MLKELDAAKARAIAAQEAAERASAEVQELAAKYVIAFGQSHGLNVSVK
ncbi:hypothetical protein [Schlesneria paludicola]|nr:hypothetical protein [Schlesneria paludicola]